MAEAAGQPPHDVEGPPPRLAAARAVGGHPRGHPVDGAVGVHGQADPDVGIHRLVEPAEGEAHLRQALVAHPLLRDRPHLHLHPAGLVGQRDQAMGQPLLGRLVQRGPHVLPGLAGERQAGQGDHGLLRDLHRAPAPRRGVVRRLLRDREQAGQQPLGLHPVGERPQEVGAVGGRRRDGVAQAEGDAGVGLVGDVSLAAVLRRRTSGSRATSSSRRDGSRRRPSAARPTPCSARPHQGRSGRNPRSAGPAAGSGSGTPGARARGRRAARRSAARCRSPAASRGVRRPPGRRRPRRGRRGSPP